MIEEIWVQIDSRPAVKLEATPFEVFTILKGLLDKGHKVLTRSRDTEQPDGWTGWLPLTPHEDGSLRRQH